ncbi:MAG: hypothetical protein ACKVOW_01175 [Chitinophagaceae bacterium]
MRKSITTLLIVSAFFSTGCIKTLFDKKKDPAEDLKTKYTGFWVSSKGAEDANGNGVVDASEIQAINGSSDLNLDNNGTYTYSIRTNGNVFTMRGDWQVNTDGKSITIMDPANGSIRFDIKNDKEIHTEPIKSNGRTTWLIYNR